KMFIFLADSPGEIEATHILDRENSHGHSEVEKGLVDLRRSCPFFDEEMCFPHVRQHHAIADEAPAISNNDSYFFQLLCQCQCGCDDFVARFCAPHDFKKAHDMCRTEEVSADHHVGPRGRGGNFVDIQCRRVCCEDAVRPGNLVNLGENPALQGH